MFKIIQVCLGDDNDDDDDDDGGNAMIRLKVLALCQSESAIATTVVKCLIVRPQFQ